MASMAFGLTPPEGLEPALYASTCGPPSILANASAIWLRFEFSTHTNSTRFTELTVIPPGGLFAGSGYPAEDIEFLAAFGRQHQHAGGFEAFERNGFDIRLVRDQNQVRLALVAADEVHCLGINARDFPRTDAFDQAYRFGWLHVAEGEATGIHCPAVGAGEHVAGENPAGAEHFPDSLRLFASEA